MPTLNYARQALFDPMDFNGTTWLQENRGSYGGVGLRIAAGDMVKLGQMFLDRGRYEGTRILPAEWVTTSVPPHLSTGNVSPYGPSYGYLWWIGSGATTFQTPTTQRPTPVEGPPAHILLPGEPDLQAPRDNEKGMRMAGRAPRCILAEWPGKTAQGNAGIATGKPGPGRARANGQDRHGAVEYPVQHGSGPGSRGPAPPPGSRGPGASSAYNHPQR